MAAVESGVEGPWIRSTKIFVDMYEGLRISSRTMATLKKPTGGELEILRVLWRRGPSTVREVVAELNEGKADGQDGAESAEGVVGYTTGLKMLQIMAEKGLVEREEKGRSHVYRAAATEERTLGQLAKDLVERAFGGSAARLVMSALSAKRASVEERAEIRRMLDEMDAAGGEGKGGGKGRSR